LKRIIFALAALLVALDAGAQSLKILSKEVKQGELLVVRVNPGWQLPTACILVEWKKVGNQEYRLNNYGYAFIGVPLDVRQGKYRIRLVECGRRVMQSRDVDEFEVSSDKFPITRTGGMSGKSSRPRKIIELRAIKNAFSGINQLQPDLTGGLRYLDPLSSRDVIDPYGRIYLGSRKGHYGVDFRTSIGTSVASVNRGVVVLVANDYSKEGNMVIISHGLGIFAVYMHLSRIDVEQGELIERGRIIGLSGDTGAGVREPHLHFNIKIYKDYIDPLKFIDTINRYLD